MDFYGVRNLAFCEDFISSIDLVKIFARINPKLHLSKVKHSLANLNAIKRP